MVVTIEPGLYIPPDSDIPSKFHGIGIRIEDDVYITDSEPVVLTDAAPKERSDIERLMAQG
jgi:Xaa-Pro aminopeptidase